MKTGKNHKCLDMRFTKVSTKWVNQGFKLDVEFSADALAVITVKEKGRGTKTEVFLEQF